MNDDAWASTRGGRTAIAAAAASALLFLWAVVYAVRIGPVPELTAPEFNTSAALATPTLQQPADIGAAVQSDLFAQDRSAPPQRYRVPGEESDDAVPKEAPVLPVVLGTAVSDAVHSFATVQLGDSHAVIMHTGDKIGEYTIRAIDRGRVVFTNAARKTLEIHELKP